MKKRKGARPKKYTSKYISKLAKKLLVWIQSPENFWLGEFAVENGFHRQRLSEFADQNQEFSEALKKASQVQENRIVKGAMAGVFNSTFCIFTLKNIAGWRDAHEITGKDGEGIPLIIYEKPRKNKDSDNGRVLEKP